MMRMPSIKTLRAAFGDAAPAARRVLKMSRAELCETPTGRARILECYARPATFDLRMTVLNSACETYGRESAETTMGEFADYLNVGEMYAATLIYWRGRYRVQSLGDFVETMERRGVYFR